MENKELYNYVGKIALEFRLSLDNVCKIMGKEPTEENKMEIYKNIEEVSRRDYDLIKEYKYLFFYETFNESDNVAMIAYVKAANFIGRYNRAKKEGNEELATKTLLELSRTDNEFNQIKSKIGKQALTEKDVEIITRYRIKHAISRIAFCEQYGISRTSFEKRDRNISNSLLKKKLDILSEFLLSIENRKIANKSK